MKVLNLLVVLICAIGFACAAVEEEEGVLVLTDDNFDEVVNNADIILVEFYAPWCGHCKKLAPEYAKAAQVLKNNDPPVPLAKVDATVHSQVAGRFDVRGYPTLKIFRHGSPSEYGGSREESGIVHYMKKQAGPAAKHLADTEAFNNFLADPDVSIVGFFHSEKGQLLDAFRKTSDLLREEFRFGLVTDQDLLKEHGQTEAVVIFSHEKGMEKKVFSGPADSTALTEWLYAKSLPLAGEINSNNENRYKRRGVPIVKLFIDVDWTTNVKRTNYYLNRLRKVAEDEALLSKVSFTIVDKKSAGGELAKFGIEDAGEAALVIDDFAGNKRYKYEGQKIQLESIRQFVQDFVNNKLEPFIKSEPIPEDNSGPVTVVVGKTFNDIVMDPTKDVLFEMYAPWCGHCKKLEPIYTELGEKVKDVKNLVIAKMDATANEANHPEYQARGYPTIVFAPANNKDHPIKYSGERDLASFTKFLKEHATAANVKDEL